MIRNGLRLLGVGLLVVLVVGAYYNAGVAAVVGFVVFLLILVAMIALGVTTFRKVRRGG